MCRVRINPEYSELPSTFGDSPCVLNSHLGVCKANMPLINLFKPNCIEVIHLYTMCVQNSNVFSELLITWRKNLIVILNEYIS